MSIGEIISQGLLRVLVVRVESSAPGTDRWRGLPYGYTTREPSARAAHALGLLVGSTAGGVGSCRSVRTGGGRW